MWRCCLNPRVVAALAGAAALLWLYAPGAVVGALPTLLLLVCPLSMAVMMWQMRKGGSCATMTTPPAAPTAGSVDAQIRELSEEVAVLRARRRLAAQRDPGPS